MEADPKRPGICVCGQRLNMHDIAYCVPFEDDENDDDEDARGRQTESSEA